MFWRSIQNPPKPSVVHAPNSKLTINQNASPTSTTQTRVDHFVLARTKRPNLTQIKIRCPLGCFSHKRKCRWCIWLDLGLMLSIDSFPNHSTADTIIDDLLLHAHEPQTHLLPHCSKYDCFNAFKDSIKRKQSELNPKHKTNRIT